MLVNFLVIQSAPGGPIENIISQYSGTAVDATVRISGDSQAEVLGQAQIQNSTNVNNKYRGAQGLDPMLISQLETMYGFDLPLHQRFFKMLGNYLLFDFGESFFQDRSVVDLVREKMPVSISLGLWTTLLIYLISIPLGIVKAIKDGSRFDLYSSAAVVVGNAIPGFLFAIFLIVMFAGGRYLDWFPLRGLTSANWEELSSFEKILDYFWHMALPILSMVIAGFAGLTLLTKNSFLEEINKQYVITARAKGLTEGRVLVGHVFRNAMLIVIAGFPSAFIGILFTGSLLTEIIFSLDGLGLLGFEAAINRDYPVMFATVYCFTLLGLVMHLIGDITYTIVDPRIDFDNREV
tara:strand:+ start:261 stop:1310 length:1050 start_codon:yes stop_codon:yes gene_type:complete